MKMEWLVKANQAKLAVFLPHVTSDLSDGSVVFTEKPEELAGRDHFTYDHREAKTGGSALGRQFGLRQGV